MTNARKAADAFADAVGEQRESIGVLDPQWRELLKSAVIEDVHCQAWPAETTLTLDDLGLHPQSDAERAAISRVVDLGSLGLLPKAIRKRSLQIRNKFRNALRNRAHTSHWGFLLTQAAYAEWKADALAIQAEGDAFAQDVYANWSKIMQEMIADYRVIGRENYARLISAGRKPELDRDEWVETFVRRCTRKMISADDWLASWRLWWDEPQYVPVASMLENEQSAEIQQALIANAKSEMERDELKGRAKQLDTGLFQFMSDVRGTVARLVFDVCADVLDAMKNGGDSDNAIPRNSSRQLGNLIDKVSKLKFWNDEALDAQLKEIQATLDLKAYERDADEVTEMLSRIGAEARMTLLSLKKPVERTTRTLGIPDDELDLVSVVRQNRSESLSEMDDAIVSVNRQPRTTGVVAA